MQQVTMAASVSLSPIEVISSVATGVVFVDDGQRTQLQQPGQGVLEIQPPSLVLHIHTGEQDLRHVVVVGGEQAVVGVHQLTLAHSGAGLLGSHITGAGGQGQLAHSHADGHRTRRG